MSNYGQVYASKPLRTIGYEESKRQRTMKKLSLRQRFRNWLFEGNSNDSPIPQDISIDDNLLDSERCIKFKIFNASGGRVIETCFYDSQKDRTKRSLYVITNDKDFGHEIDKIITMEHLKQ